MKKLLLALMFLVGIIFLPAAAWAEDAAPEPQKSGEAVSTKSDADPSKSSVKNPIEKFNRGIVNIITAPIEIAKQVDKSWKESTEKSTPKSTGIFSGFMKGIAYTLGRVGSGVWDVVSFPFKTPENYEPLMKPDYVLDKK